MVNRETNSKMEIVGRMLLWEMAFEHVWHVLGVAVRAKSASKDQVRRQREDDWNRRFRKFIEWVHGPTSNAIYAEHPGYEAIDPCPFPKTGECYTLYENNVLLAAVIFGQVYNSGSRHEGAVADNRSVARILQDIEETMLMSVVIQPDQFTELKRQITFIRNKALGHADGAIFELSHGDQITSHKTYYSFASDLDVNLWRRVALGLRDASSQKRLELR